MESFTWKEARDGKAKDVKWGLLCGQFVEEQKHGKG